jgi:hypothetical protein
MTFTKPNAVISQDANSTGRQVPAQGKESYSASEREDEEFKVQRSPWWEFSLRYV